MKLSKIIVSEKEETISINHLINRAHLTNDAIDIESYKVKAMKEDATSFPINSRKQDIIYHVDRALEEDDHRSKTTGNYCYTMRHAYCTGYKYRPWKDKKLFQTRVIYKVQYANRGRGHPSQNHIAKKAPELSILRLKNISAENKCQEGGNHVDICLKPSIGRQVLNQFVTNSRQDVIELLQEFNVSSLSPVSESPSLIGSNGIAGSTFHAGTAHSQRPEEYCLNVSIVITKLGACALADQAASQENSTGPSLPNEWPAPPPPIQQSRETLFSSLWNTIRSPRNGSQRHPLSAFPNPSEGSERTFSFCAGDHSSDSEEEEVVYENVGPRVSQSSQSRDSREDRENHENREVIKDHIDQIEQQREQQLDNIFLCPLCGHTMPQGVSVLYWLRATQTAAQEYPQRNEQDELD
ncbi:hypothetical protein ACROYT_G015356 [Oculina patagonica]